MKRTIQFGKTLLLALIVLTASCKKEDDVLIITLKDLTLSIDENPTSGQIIGTVESSSPNDITFSISSQTPSGALNISASTGELTVANATLFDFETNPIITATVTVAGAANTASVTINLTNVNEISVQNFSANINENPINGQSLGTVQATGNGTLTYGITAQTPTGALSINSSTGELTVANPALFDFETNPILTATVSVAGASNNASVTITLTNVNEVDVQNFTATINENPANGQSLGTVQATGDAKLTYSITTQTLTGALSINSSTGELTVANNALFNFETNSTITATIAVNNSGTIKNLTATINLTNVLHEVGEYKFGGVIFWVNAAGNEGLVCAITDQSAGIRWYNGSNGNTGAVGTAIGTGKANTTAIVNFQGAGSYAAQLCNDLSLNGHNDWFLPSIDELKEMYNNKTVINSTSLTNSGTAFKDAVGDSNYWTSTQVTNSSASIISFTDGFSQAGSKGINSFSVRAVRAWTDF